jgi:hypothetical protein
MYAMMAVISLSFRRFRYVGITFSNPWTTFLDGYSIDSRR